MRAPVFESGHVAETGLPPQFEVLLAAYVRHLRGQRNLAEHTVRSYRTDLVDLFSHLDRLGIDSIDKVDLRALRSWLAKQHTLGHARTTLQRRAAAARVFFAWAQETGQLATDPAANLRSPKTTRVLPPTLDRVTAAQMLDEAIATARETGGPAAARDVAVLEVLSVGGGYLRIRCNSIAVEAAVAELAQGRGVHDCGRPVDEVDVVPDEGLGAGGVLGASLGGHREVGRTQGWQL